MAPFHLDSSQESFFGLSRIFTAGKREDSIRQGKSLGREAKEHGEGTRTRKSPFDCKYSL